ncbi:winged helix-turn-helix domain-containing protein [Amycolatopsis magusensis]|uniref:winged helix-turn-helix domain-containing protein n=1 Tax=Amycolatopsis magusensis TaxID=882444 RepID=UPI003C2D100C
MLRIIFTPADHGRVRLSATPHLLWETVLSIHRIRDPAPDARHRPWLAETASLTRRPAFRSALRLLRQLIPPHGYFPDFLTPLHGRSDLESSVEVVTRTPSGQLDGDLRRLGRNRPLSPGALELLTEPAGGIEKLATALLTYHRTALAPFWEDLEADVRAERADRTRLLLDAGPGALMATLHPTIRWLPPVLEADYPVHRELHLRGRGLLLIPSAFCARTPVAFADPALPPLLVYPLTQTSPAGPRVTDKRHDSLARLLGSTRATVLRTLTTADPTTGTEIARFAGLPVSTVSEHTVALRQARLIETRPFRNNTLHTLTPLGAAVIAVHSPRP